MERRTAAIAAIDVVGYTAMLEHDGAGTLAALDSLRRVCFEPLLGEGRLFRLLGDGSLFEFAQAGEATRFAIAVQEQVRHARPRTAAGHTISLRIGIDFGEIIFDGRDLHGEAINVASRLEAMAPDGHICISSRGLERLDPRQMTLFSPIGPRALKGLDAPVSVWRWPQAAAVPLPPAAPAHAPAANGRQVLDPKVTQLLLIMHMRSARLAVSDAIDGILALPNEGRGLPHDEIYGRIGAKLNAARDLLAPIGIQCIDNVEAHMRSEQQIIMSTFMANVFDNARTAYVFPLLNQISTILQSNEPLIARRAAINDTVETFMRDTMLARCTSLIKYAFVGP